MIVSTSCGCVHDPMRNMMNGFRALILFVLATYAHLLTGASAAQEVPKPGTVSLPSETPAKFVPVTSVGLQMQRRNDSHARRGETAHRHPGAQGGEEAPILLTRTPYNATELTSHSYSAHLGPILWGYDNTTEVIIEGGYIRVVQDVRGKYGSEGDYVMNRPLHGTAQSHRRGSLDRHLRHHRLAGEKHPGEQRQGGYPGHFIRRFFAVDGARQSAPGAQSGRTHESHGGWMDG